MLSGRMGVTEETGMILIAFITARTRFGASVSEAKTMLVERGVDRKRVEPVSSAIGYLMSQMQQNVPIDEIRKTMLQQGISDQIVQFIMDELTINSGRMFLQHIYFRVFQDLHCLVDGSERKKRFPNGRKDTVDAKEYASLLGWVTDHNTQLFRVCPTWPR